VTQGDESSLLVTWFPFFLEFKSAVTAGCCVGDASGPKVSSNRALHQIGLAKLRCGGFEQIYRLHPTGSWKLEQPGKIPTQLEMKSQWICMRCMSRARMCRDLKFMKCPCRVRSPHFDIWWLRCYDSVQSCSGFLHSLEKVSSSIMVVKFSRDLTTCHNLQSPDPQNNMSSRMTVR
jgi:hypothetical protein